MTIATACVAIDSDSAVNLDTINRPRRRAKNALSMVTTPNAHEAVASRNSSSSSIGAGSVVLDVDMTAPLTRPFVDRSPIAGCGVEE
jgi:hypothetical protein